MVSVALSPSVCAAEQFPAPLLGSLLALLWDSGGIFSPGSRPHQTLIVREGGSPVLLCGLSLKGTVLYLEEIE